MHVRALFAVCATSSWAAAVHQPVWSSPPPSFLHHSSNWTMHLRCSRCPSRMAARRLSSRCVRSRSSQHDK
eukprot:scaffold127543_cov21-Tisochrysis_lutea.AAC.1